MMAHQSRLGVVVIDCKTDDLSEAARFWSRAFGCDAEVDATFPAYVALDTPAGDPRVLLQAVDHESRVHIDIETDDKEAERDRLVRLGAREIGPVKDWIVMEAPSGHRFCLVGPQRPDFKDNSKQWGDG